MSENNIENPQKQTTKKDLFWTFKIIRIGTLIVIAIWVAFEAIQRSH